MSAARRGRPVDPGVRARALDAAADLLDEAGWRRFSIEAVAKRSHMSKATIYSHWPGRFALAAEAWGVRVTAAVVVEATGDPAADLVEQAVRLNRFYASPQGRVVAELLGASISEPDGARLMRERFFDARRQRVLGWFRDGVERGLLRDDLDPEVMNDILFGAAVLRLFNGLPPLGDAEAATGARAIVDGFRPRPAPEPPPRSAPVGSSRSPFPASPHAPAPSTQEPRP